MKNAVARGLVSKTLTRITFCFIITAHLKINPVLSLPEKRKFRDIFSPTNFHLCFLSHYLKRILNMSYKPFYCCNCGEKIERSQWLPWTSRRFCEVCEKDFKFQENFPFVLIAVFGLFGLFGIGSYLTNGESAKTVALKQNKFPVAANSVKTSAEIIEPQNVNRQIVQKNEPKTETESIAASNIKKEQAQKIAAAPIENEKVYFCGAATKKGTPCSRKVKGGGRCWQHKGQEAMVSPEKLLITQ